MGFNYEIVNCEYDDGIDWKCLFVIRPFGGTGLYNVYITDADPPTTYMDVTVEQAHNIQSRRCLPWVNEIRIEDANTGATLSQNLYFDPNVSPISTLLGGECTVP